MSGKTDLTKPALYCDAGPMGPAGVLFDGVKHAWEIVARLQDGAMLDRIVREACNAAGPRGAVAAGDGIEYRSPDDSGGNGLVVRGSGVEILPGTIIRAGNNAVFIGAGARIGPNVYIDASKGSIFIGERVQLRQGAYLRENSFIGAGAVIGNSSEVKCSIVGAGAEVPHFNYVGDSILGHKAHLGAGAKLSNLKIAGGADGGRTVKIRHDGAVYDTGLRKFGAVIGDGAQLGSNCVTNPGTLIGRNAVIYPNSTVGGIVPARTIHKLRQASERAGLDMGRPGKADF